MTTSLVEGDALSVELIRSIRALEAALERQTSLRESAERKLQLGRQDLDDEFERLLLRCQELEAAEIRQIKETEARLKEVALAARLEALQGETYQAQLAESEAAFRRSYDAQLTDLREAVAAKDAAFGTLQGRLRDARSSATAAHLFAQASRRAITQRRDDLALQSADLDRAAASARAEVIELAAEVEARWLDEAAAAERRHHAQRRFDAILQDERQALQPRGGVKDTLALGRARRWRRTYKIHAALMATIEEAAAEIEKARQDLDTRKEQRWHAEQIATAAEPRASALETAASVVRGEVVEIEAILSALPDFPGGDPSSWKDDYGRWVDLYDTLTEIDRRAIKARLTRLDYKPLISVVVPVYNTPLAFLRQAVASVQAQLYEHWELCLADDASPDAEVVETLQAFADADPRIKLFRRDTNGHISAASNSALTLATGEFIALLDHDDLLAEQALFEIVACLNDHPHLDLIYSDEDHIDQRGTRSEPYFKSDYNHELMLGHNLINHLGVYRRSIVEQVGGFRLGYEGSQDYDLALRVIDASSPEKIHHIPAVLYHWRSNSGAATFSEAALQRCITAARTALGDHLARRGQAGEVVEHPTVPAWHRVKRPRPHPAPLVSIIVPTKDKAEILGPCAEGLLNHTDYPNVELIIVDHQSTDPATLALMLELSKDSRVRILPYTGPFNYSAINNAAVEQANGSVLALLNNDVDVINADWLDEMVSLAVLPDVGAVGAKLLYPDDRVQHAGVVLGTGGVAGHFFHLLGADDPGYVGRAVLTSAISAVTAACLVVRKTVFLEAGGFDSVNLPVAFNDVDLCLKIRENGYRNVWTPHAKLHHHESISRGSDQVGERLERFNGEVAFMMEKWDELLAFDPFYNPNLNLASADFRVAFPPRRTKTWRPVDLIG